MWICELTTLMRWAHLSPTLGHAPLLGIHLFLGMGTFPQSLCTLQSPLKCPRQVLAKHSDWLPALPLCPRTAGREGCPADAVWLCPGPVRAQVALFSHPLMPFLEGDRPPLPAGDLHRLCSSRAGWPYWGLGSASPGHPPTGIILARGLGHMETLVEPGACCKLGTLLWLRNLSGRV
jgi:hypothetical protein